MNINLYNENLERIAIIGEQFISCLWQEEYNGKGNLSLELQATDEYKCKVRPECYVGRKDRKTLMVIKSVVVKNGKITATGFSAKKQLDDVAFIGTIEANSFVTTSIKNAYDNSTKFANISIVDSGLTDKYPQQISHKSFFTLMETMCKAVDMGFKSVKNGNQIDIEFYKPAENPNLRFSQQFGNLADENLTLSTAKFKNYAIVLGQGEGDNRVRVDVDLSNGEQKRELIVDAKDLQQEDGESLENYKTRLIARGNEKLLEAVKTWVVSFLPSPTEFGSKFDLGDILTITLNDFNLKIKARIASFQQKEQHNKTITTINVGSLTLIK